MTPHKRPAAQPQAPAQAPSQAPSQSPSQSLAIPIAQGLSEALPLVLLGMAMLYTDRLFTFGDDEATTVSAAAQPLRTFLQRFFAGVGQQTRPPLYDVWLHLWLRISHGIFPLLRAPSMVFFLLGLWMLSRAARILGGESSATALLWTAVLWPYGFLYGRLAGWYAFTFLLISALTWTYLRYQSAPTRRRWAVVCLLAVALIYSNYAGWALLALLGVDDWLRNRTQRRATIVRLLATTALLLVVFAPLWFHFAADVRNAVELPHNWKSAGLTAGYNLYALVVSESVAPWFWRFSVPATIAVGAALLAVFFFVREGTRRFYIFAALLFAGMDILGFLQTRFLLLLAPWFLLPVAVALGTIKLRYARIALALSLAVAAAVGWYGMYTRRFFIAERFVEPWAQISAEAAKAVQDGGLVIGNNPSFFFYLTYDLHAPQTSSQWRFSGSLPKAVHHPSVWSASGWLAEGRPIRPYMLWIWGISSEGGSSAIMDDASQFLDSRCGERVVRHLVHDAGNEWKKRFLPGYDIPWRIETRQYACDIAAATPPAAGAATPPKPAPARK